MFFDLRILITPLESSNSSSAIAVLYHKIISKSSFRHPSCDILRFPINKCCVLRLINGGLLKLSNMAGYGDLVPRVIERVPLVAQELLTFPEDPSSHPDYRVVHS